MSETRDPHSLPYDDAPNSTAKHTHGDREVASDAVTIGRPVDEVYDFCRDLTKAPLYMRGIERVEVSGAHTHWVGEHGEWDAQIINDRPNEEFTWQSADSSGRALFEAVEGRGTVLTFTTAYEQGFFAKLVGKITQDDPAIQQRRNLRRLKQLLETGEIATNACTQRELAEENR